MKASLRRSQGQPSQARELLHRALVIDGGGGETRYLLLNLAKTLETMGQYEEAIEVLHKGAQRIDQEREPHCS